MLGPAQWPRGLGLGTLLWPSMRFGVQGQLSNLIQLLNLRLDSYLVLLLVNSAGVGIYAVGVSLSEGMWFIANSVGVVLLTNLTASDDESAGPHDAAGLPQHAAGHTGIGAIAGAGAVSPFVIPLIFGSDFDAAVCRSSGCCPAPSPRPARRSWRHMCSAAGRPLVNAQIAYRRRWS